MTKGKGLGMTNRNYQAISPCAAFTRDVYYHIIIKVGDQVLWRYGMRCYLSWWMVLEKVVPAVGIR